MRVARNCGAIRRRASRARAIVPLSRPAARSLLRGRRTSTRAPPQAVRASRMSAENDRASQRLQTPLEAGCHGHVVAMGGFERAGACGFKREVFAPAAAALRSGLADPGSDQALVFEAIQRRIDRADRQTTGG